MRRIIALAAGLALALTGVAMAATGGSYTGTTSQAHAGVHYPIRFSVSGTNITGGLYGANYGGHAGCSVSNGVFTRWGRGIKGGSAVKIKNNNTFSANVRIAPADYLKIHGKFTGTTVTGSFDETFTAEHLVNGHVHLFNCTTGNVAFSAALA